MKELVDVDAKSAVSEIISREKPRSILLFTGSKSYELSPLKKYFDNLAEDLAITRYSKFENNPNHDDLVKAINAFGSEKPDLIVAMGGGSVMDFAKLVNIYLENKEALNRDVLTVTRLRSAAPMVMIPTTAGSGSEVTNFMVLFKNGRKHSLACPSLKIEYVIVDPRLTYSLSPRQTAISGIDALCQAIESLWARSGTDESRKYARQALELIYPNIRNAVNHPNEHSRRAMSVGAYYAGKAINISKTTGPHAFSYYLTEKLNIPHGEAVAINFELFIDLNFPCLSRDTIEDLFRIFQVESKDEFIQEITNLKSELNLKVNLTDAGVDSEAVINEYIKFINDERMMNNPKKLTKKMIYEELLKCIK